METPWKVRTTHCAVAEKGGMIVPRERERVNTWGSAQENGRGDVEGG